MQSIESDFIHPPLTVTASLLRDHFKSDVAKQLRPLRNVHHETRVSAATMASARPAAVLIPIVQTPAGSPREELSLLLTRRHQRIRFAGHICFPGGHRDAIDDSFEATALREAREEINLDPAAVEILGRLGDYYTQTGYRIVPIVGLVSAPLDLAPHPDEVDEIIEVALNRVFRADSYQLHSTGANRAHYSFTHKNARVAGPTVSIMMGFYEELLRSRKLA